MRQGGQQSLAAHPCTKLADRELPGGMLVSVVLAEHQEGETPADGDGGCDVGGDSHECMAPLHICMVSDSTGLIPLHVLLSIAQPVCCAMVACSANSACGAELGSKLRVDFDQLCFVQQQQRLPAQAGRFPFPTCNSRDIRSERSSTTPLLGNRVDGLLTALRLQLSSHHNRNLHCLPVSDSYTLLHHVALQASARVSTIRSKYYSCFMMLIQRTT